MWKEFTFVAFVTDVLVKEGYSRAHQHQTGAWCSVGHPCSLDNDNTRSSFWSLFGNNNPRFRNEPTDRRPPCLCAEHVPVAVPVASGELVLERQRQSAQDVQDVCDVA